MFDWHAGRKRASFPVGLGWSRVGFGLVANGRALRPLGWRPVAGWRGATQWFRGPPTSARPWCGRGLRTPSRVPSPIHGRGAGRLPPRTVTGSGWAAWRVRSNHDGRDDVTVSIRFRNLDKLNRCSPVRGMAGRPRLHDSIAVVVSSGLRNSATRSRNGAGNETE